MKVAILFLDYLRHDHSAQALQSIVKAGHPFDLFTINRKGIAAALNEGIDKTTGYDAIVTCANDILMPEGWLHRMVTACRAIPETGMCGIHCVEGLEEMEIINGVQLHRSFTAFGNAMIPRAAISAIGYFNEEFDPYGMQDADYAYRLNKSGFVNYYLHGMKSEHIGHDVGNGTEYRRMKDDGLKKAGDIWGRSTARYDETENYTINQPQTMQEYEGFRVTMLEEGTVVLPNTNYPE